MTWVTAVVVAGVIAAAPLAWAAEAPVVAPPPSGTDVNATLNDVGAGLSAQEIFNGPRGVTPGGGTENVALGVTPVSQVEYKSTLGCGDTSDPAANVDPAACTMAQVLCDSSVGPGSILYYVWFRRAGSGGAWQFAGQTCSREALPPGEVPPAVPSMAQIQQAFAQLPFGKPTVSIQPVGGVTLVNLPTFYEIGWDGSGLEPGQVSAPVQLLSWSVEFQPLTQSFDVDFGDGTRSGPTTDIGGTYPDGSIRHSYLQPVSAADVRVDAVLTGRFRVNGGDWVDVGSVADLQDEPVTVLRVAEARARLYNE